MIDELMTMLGTIGPDDVAQIEERIAGLQQQIDRLRQVRRLIAPPATNGTAHRPASHHASTGSIQDRRKLVVRLLAAEGAMLANAIASRLSIPNGSITRVLGCGWFEKSSRGYMLTADGQAEASRSKHD